MADEIVPVFAIATVLIGMPWLFLHYITKWRQMKTLSSSDEAMLAALHDRARQLDTRLNSIERIVAADVEGSGVPLPKRTDTYDMIHTERSN